MDRYPMVLAGAGLGGLARYVAGTWIMAKYAGRFPLGTFVINVTGSFVIGVLMTLLTERFHPHPHWRLFLVVGVLGGYTTFSDAKLRSGNPTPLRFFNCELRVRPKRLQLFNELFRVRARIKQYPDSHIPADARKSMEIADLHALETPLSHESPVVPPGATNSARKPSAPSKLTF